MPISGDVLYPFKWYYRPEVPATQVLPIVQIRGDEEEVPQEQLHGVLAEIDNRHWGVIRQLLIEAKIKAESYLRSDEIVGNPSLSAYYLGQVAQVDYILANFEGLRAGLLGTDQAPQPVVSELR